MSSQFTFSRWNRRPRRTAVSSLASSLAPVRLSAESAAMMSSCSRSLSTERSST